MFNYDYPYFLESEHEKVALVGAYLSKDGCWTFFQGGENPIRVLPADTTFDFVGGGAIACCCEDDSCRMVQASIATVQAHPEAYGLTPEQAGALSSPYDMHRIGYSDRVPQWYEEAAAERRPLEEALLLAADENLQQIAPVGMKMLWEKPEADAVWMQKTAFPNEDGSEIHRWMQIEAPPEGE